MDEAVAAANGYEDLLVPALFERFAGPLLDSAQIRPGDHVLDVACGTGVVARAAASRVGPDGRVVGLDPGVGMLAVAERLAPELSWRRGVAESLPFGDASFDAVTSQFGLMFFTDPNRAIREMRRVLKGGGRMTVAVWDSLSNNPAYAASVGLLDRMAGRAAADAVRAPFSLGASDELLALVRRAGVESPSLTTYAARAEFPNIRAMVEADLRGWLPLMGVSLSESAIAAILEQAETELGQYRTPSGTMAFQASAHIVSASK